MFEIFRQNSLNLQSGAQNRTPVSAPTMGLVLRFIITSLIVLRRIRFNPIEKGAAVVDRN